LVPHYVASLWPSARAMPRWAAGSGSNSNPESVRRVTLRLRTAQQGEENPLDRSFSILLVEDNAADAALVREALEEHRIRGELVVIADGAAAIRYIEALDTGPSGCPDLVILDLNLPKRSGHEVLRSMRQSVKCGRAPVAILSSSDAQQDRVAAASLGASQYYRKPLHLKEFLSLGARFKAMLEPPAGDSL